MLNSNLILKLGFIVKLNLIPKLVFILKLNLILKLGFILKFVYIQTFELILNILEHPKPSIASLKQPGRLVACYLEITPMPFLTKILIRLCGFTDNSLILVVMSSKKFRAMSTAIYLYYK